MPQDTGDSSFVAWVVGGFITLCVILFKHISPFHVVSKAINLALESHLKPLKDDISEIRAVIDHLPGAELAHAAAAEESAAKKRRWGGP